MKTLTLAPFRTLGGLLLLTGVSLSCSPGSGSSLSFAGQGNHGAGGNGTSGSGSAASGNGAGAGGDVVFTSGGSGSSHFGADAGCLTDVHQGERLPLDMYFLVDQSGSMNEGVQGGTKWSVIANALNTFFADPANAATGAGIGYFPFTGTGGSSATCQNGDPGCVCLGTFCFNLTAVISNVGGSCTVSDYATPDVGIALLQTNAPLLTASLQKHGPGGGTPTSPALQGAYQYTTGWAQQNPGRRTVLVLATDGDPTGCTANDVPTISSQVVGPALAGNPSIMTFVIGVGSSLTSLNALAQAGGTGQAFIVDTTQDVAQQFTQALDKIRGQAATCDFKVPNDGSVDPNKVNAAYTPPNSSTSTDLYQVDDASKCQDPSTPPDQQHLQWYFNSDHTLLSLCTIPCDKLKNDGGQVQVVLGCPTVVDPIQ